MSRATPQGPTADEEGFRLLVEGVRDYAIFRLDPNGFVATWNLGAQRLKGYTAGEIIGKHFSSFYPPEDVAAGKCEDELEVAMREGRVEDEGWRVRKDGERFWANVVITALFDRNDKLVGFAKVTRDMSERRRHEEELRLARDRAQTRLEVLQRVAVELQESIAPGDVVGRLLSIAVDIARADRATLSSLRDGLITIEATTGAGSAVTWVNRTYGVDFLESFPEFRQAFESRKPVAGGRLAAENAAPEFREAMAVVKHTMTIPLISGDEHLGFLLLSRMDDEPFDAEALDMMGIIASVAGLALKNAWAYAFVEQAHRTKSEFLNAAAHELRTPSTVTQGYIDLMIEGRLGEPPESWQRPLELLRVTGERMSQLIESILDAARLDAGTATVKFAAVDLGELVTQALERAAARVALTGATVTHHLPESPVIATTNAGLIGRVIDNLIDNALTYHGGAPTIDVTVTADPMPEITIRDAGLGIPDDQQQAVFDRFVRVIEPPWNQFRGTGLGLHLSRQFAEASGAQLTLRSSRVGSGSVFVLSFPGRDAALTD